MRVTFTTQPVARPRGDAGDRSRLRPGLVRGTGGSRGWTCFSRCGIE